MRMFLFVWLISVAGGLSADLDREVRHVFEEWEGCFILYSLSEQREIIKFNPAMCATRLSPCSTFKIPNALIALDLNVLNQESVLAWDGTKQPFQSWERDHTLASAIANSVVWFFAEIAHRVGHNNYRDYLARFNYGNRDFSSGLDRFWLGGKSLRISPNEQITFLNRFYRDQLPVSPAALAAVKSMLVLKRGDHWALSGKTGSGTNLGWFVGYLATNDEQYTFAICLQGENVSGLTAKALVIQLFQASGLTS